MVRFQMRRRNITLHFTRSCSEAVMRSSWVNPPFQDLHQPVVGGGGRIQGAAPHQSGSTAGAVDWIEAKGQDLGGLGETRPKTTWVKNNIMISPSCGHPRSETWIQAGVGDGRCFHLLSSESQGRPSRRVIFSKVKLYRHWSPAGSTQWSKLALYLMLDRLL